VLPHNANGPSDAISLQALQGGGQELEVGRRMAANLCKGQGRSVKQRFEEGAGAAFSSAWLGAERRSWMQGSNPADGLDGAARS
jgi:hypothetical protein